MAIFTRPWHYEDRQVLTPMVADMLAVTAEAGADLLPTPKNIGVLVDLGLNWAAMGEPTLIAHDDARPIGCILWGNLGNPLGLDIRGPVCAALGTYVVPAYRRLHVALRLRQDATERAKFMGYTRIQGTAFHDAGILSAQFAGFHATGAILELTL